MAACSQTTLTITQAGIADTIGTYTSTSVDANNKSIYNKTGGTPYNQIKFIVSNVYYWHITAPAFPGAPFGTTAYYSQDFGSLEAAPDCPTDPSIVWTGNPPHPTITAAAPPGPNCADPLERCTFAVPGESGRSRFRRLVALGYV